MGVEQTVVESVDFDEDAAVVVVHVRPAGRGRGRCGRCGRRSPWFDRGQGRRRWRTLDLGTLRAYLEAGTPRVDCAEHGPTVIWVPWARHGVGHTRGFDDQVAWLATHISKSAVSELMRIAWRTVGSIVARVWADTEAAVDQFAGLRRIGIDEISYRRGQRFLVVVVDHDSGRLVWAAPGRDRATVRRFFDAVEASGPGRCTKITHVSADGAAWIGDVVAQRCPEAVRALDPFHVVHWATESLDALRREAWHRARAAAGGTRPGGRGAGRPLRRSIGVAQQLGRSRYPLLKNPENLTERQQLKLAWIAKNDPRLYRGYLLKEGLRTILRLGPEEASGALDRWTSWARRSRLEPFVALQRRITRHRAEILAAIEHHLSNGRIESVNTKIRLITRNAFGFAGPDPLIALAMLSLGGHRPTLPGRT